MSRLRSALKAAARFSPLVVAVGLLGTFGVNAEYRSIEKTRTTTPQATGTNAPGVGGKRIVVGGGESTAPIPGLPQQPGLACAPGRNGGATAPGVTANKIRLASTMVQSGIGKSFLGDSPIGMKAVVAKVNRAGGICGRILELRLVDDGWDAPRGQRFLQGFIKEEYFALPVVPSSEGLTQAIRAGDITDIPVVGTDGMLRDQYTNSWVWPVATATASTMRIMAKHGRSAGSKSFAIVYDRFYKFGREGAEAFRNHVKAMGGNLKAYVGIQPGQASYSAEIQQFNKACQDGCDFVAMLLEPATAETWIAGRPRKATVMTSGAQTLFNERFAKNCAAACDGMLVWTGYNPPIGTLASLPGIREYVNDVKSISPTADETNQFLEGAYIGMSVFVDALRLVGPNLTRAGLQSALSRMQFTSDLSSPLAFNSTRSGGHVANTRAQAFAMVVAGGSFSGFRNLQTGFIPDPVPGLIG